MFFWPFCTKDLSRAPNFDTTRRTIISWSKEVKNYWLTDSEMDPKEWVGKCSDYLTESVCQEFESNSGVSVATVWLTSHKKCQFMPFKRSTAHSLSLPLFLSFSICLSLSLSLWFSICMCLFQYLSFSFFLSILPSFSLSSFLSFSLPLILFLSLSISLSLSHSFYLSLCLLVFLSISPLLSLFICVSFNICLYLFLSLSSFHSIFSVFLIFT